MNCLSSCIFQVLFNFLWDVFFDLIVHFHFGYGSLDLWGSKMMMGVTWRMQGLLLFLL